MALTTTEKRILDTTLRNHIAELVEMCSNGGQISARWIHSQLINWNITLAYKISPSHCYPSIDASLCRICEDSKFDGIHIHHGSPGCFKLFEGVDWVDFARTSFDTIERKGSVVILNRYGNAYPFAMIDFKNKTVSAIAEDGRIIPCPSMEISREINLNDVFAREWVFSYYNEVINNKGLCGHFDLRWFSSANQIPTTCPKGYIEYCYSNGVNPFAGRTLQKFNIATKLGKFWGNFIVDRIYRERYNLAVECIMKLSAEKIANRVKREIFVEGNMKALQDAELLLEDVMDYKYCLDHFVFDENRSLKKNRDALIELANKEKNARLAEKLQTLNFLNGLTEAGYTIVVPQNIIDLQNEGRQQHNCVGSHYNDSILRGRNLIYFIRKTENVSESYITCRYSLLDNDTVEYRKFANKLVTAPEDIECVKRISEVIKNYLDTNANE